MTTAHHNQAAPPEDIDLLALLERALIFFRKYKWIFIANLLSAYGMLLSFPWQGYNSVSIIFSTLSIWPL